MNHRTFSGQNRNYDPLQSHKQTNEPRSQSSCRMCEQEDPANFAAQNSQQQQPPYQFGFPNIQTLSPNNYQNQQLQRAFSPHNFEQYNGIVTNEPSRVDTRQDETKNQNKKLRKKYKRLKQESSRAHGEQAAEAEKLKLRIHELQSELQKRSQEDRSNDLKNSEGYQGLVNKYTQELSVQQEQILKLERTVVARES